MEFQEWFLESMTSVEDVVVGQFESMGAHVQHWVKLVVQRACKEFSDRYIEDSVTGILKHNSDHVPMDTKNLGKMEGKHREAFMMNWETDDKEMLLSRVLGWARSHAQGYAMRCDFGQSQRLLAQIPFQSSSVLPVDDPACC